MTQPGASPDRVQQMTQVMLHRAEVLWGPESVGALREHVEELARRLQELEVNPPGPEVEPGFFMVQV